MATQLDRIENMLKVLIEALTTIDLAGNTTQQKSLRNEVEKYTREAHK